MQFLCECMKIDCEIDCDARGRWLQAPNTRILFNVGHTFRYTFRTEQNLKKCEQTNH